MNIAFISGSIKEAQFLIHIADWLKENFSIKSHFIFTRKHLYNKFADTIEYEVFFREFDGSLCDSKIRESIKKYEHANLPLLASSDPVLGQKSSTYALSVFSSYLRFWENLLEKKNIKAILHYPTATVAGRSAFLVGQSIGIKHLIFQTGPVIDKNFVMCDNTENWLWSEFLNKYQEQPFEVTDDISDAIEEFVSNVITTKNKSIKIRKINLKILFSSFYRLAKEKKFDAIERNEFKKILSSFFRKIPLLGFRYDRIIAGEKYILFPLHISWDAQIATRNPMYSNQFYLVEILSKSLPYGYKLYVKEHPYNYGGEKIRLLNQIKKLSNVKLIHPEHSSIDLIEKSSAVVTINSTAGWETIILNKPLVTFGNTFYAFFKYAYPVNAVRELPIILQKLLAKNWSEFVETEEYNRERYKFLWAVLSTASEGAATSYKNYMGLGAKVNDENIKAVAKNIFKKLDE